MLFFSVIEAKYRLVYKLHFNKIALGSQRVKDGVLEACQEFCGRRKRRRD